MRPLPPTPAGRSPVAMPTGRICAVSSATANWRAFLCGFPVLRRGSAPAPDASIGNGLGRDVDDG